MSVDFQDYTMKLSTGQLVEFKGRVIGSARHGGYKTTSNRGWKDRVEKYEVEIIETELGNFVVTKDYVSKHDSSFSCLMFEDADAVRDHFNKLKSDVPRRAFTNSGLHVARKI